MDPDQLSAWLTGVRERFMFRDDVLENCFYVLCTTSVLYSFDSELVFDPFRNAPRRTLFLQRFGADDRVHGAVRIKSGDQLCVAADRDACGDYRAGATGGGPEVRTAAGVRHYKHGA